MTLLLISAALTAYIVMSYLFRSLAPSPPLSASRLPLTLSQDGTFKLSLLSDLHYGEAESSFGIDQDANSSRATASLLSLERPLDLAVLLGDLITGGDTLRHNSSAYVRRVVAPLVAAGVPWASVYGNHDSSANLSREGMLAVEGEYPTLSRTGRRERGGREEEGVTNYYLLVYAYESRGERGRDMPVAVLWFFDSRGGERYAGDGGGDEGGDDDDGDDDVPNWVAPETARWFRDEARALRARYGGRVLPGLAFVHIPPRVFLTAQGRGIDRSLFPGVNDDVPVAIQGSHGEDSEFVDALREEWKVGGLNSVYVGHDHGNAWCALWPGDGGGELDDRGEAIAGGPFLCFGKHTGYGGYGTWNRGARIVQLRFVDRTGDGSLEMEVETWVRMESGEVVTRVTLNQTYGSDKYPVDDGESHR